MHLHKWNIYLPVQPTFSLDALYCDLAWSSVKAHIHWLSHWPVGDRGREQWRHWHPPDTSDVHLNLQEEGQSNPKYTHPVQCCTSSVLDTFFSFTSPFLHDFFITSHSPLVSFLAVSSLRVSPLCMSLLTNALYTFLFSLTQHFTLLCNLPPDNWPGFMVG